MKRKKKSPSHHEKMPPEQWKELWDELSWRMKQRYKREDLLQKKQPLEPPPKPSSDPVKVDKLKQLYMRRPME